MVPSLVGWPSDDSMMLDLARALVETTSSLGFDIWVSLRHRVWLLAAQSIRHLSTLCPMLASSHLGERGTARCQFDTVKRMPFGNVDHLGTLGDCGSSRRFWLAAIAP